MPPGININLHPMQNKQALIALKKAASSLKKNQKMLEDGDYCIDIIQQNLAVIGLVKAANHSILEKHLQNCFKNAMRTDNNKKQEEMIQEILKIMKTVQKN